MSVDGWVEYAREVADHLTLPPAIPMVSKRQPSSRYNPNPPPFDRAKHAATLRGVLEGIESARTGVFAGPTGVSNDDDEVEAADLGEIVLKFTGTAPFAHGAFKQWSMMPVASNDDRQYFVLSDAAARSTFRELARAYEADPDGFTDVKSWRAVLENVADVELYDASDRVTPGVSAPADGTVTRIDIALWPTSLATLGAEREGRRRVAAIRTLIEAYADGDAQVAVLAADDVHPDRLLVHASVDASTYAALVDHPYVERLRAPIAAAVTATTLSAAEGPFSVILPEGAPIGILDDLVVDSNPWMQNVIVEQRHFPPDYVFGDNTRHGTEVAGIAAWGNIRQLLEPDFEGQPHPLYVARIAQASTDLKAEVVGSASQQISDGLDWLAECGVKIVVLALGHDYADDGAIPSDLSSTVDAKARELGLVIVTSAGNVRDIGDAHWHADYPTYLHDATSKVAAPGSAALAVTVGAVAHTDVFDVKRYPYGLAIAPADHPAPYTRTGPSRGGNAAGRQKPEFAAHGGSWAWNEATDSPITDDTNLGAATLIPPVNGRWFGTAAGTSYAAPLVAHEIARIQTRYPEASANLLRALSALAGTRAAAPNTAHGKTLVGLYGVPDAGRVLESGDNRVIFVYEGEMATNAHTVLEIPVPPEFAAGASERELRVALAFDPPVRRSRRDYIAGSMRYDFIHKASLADIRNAYATQPTVKEQATDPGMIRYDPLAGRPLVPPKTRLSSDTLICRSYHRTSGGWDEDDRNYHLVITHEHSRWTPAQRNKYPSQTFAVAVELVDIGRPELALYELAEARLRSRTRARGQRS